MPFVDQTLMETMATSDSQAPSCWQEWTFRSIESPGQTGPPVRARFLNDDDGHVSYGLLDVPRLVRSGGTPRFSLVVLLERIPEAGEESIRPLIVSGYLTLDLDYALPADVASQLSATRIFARQAQLELHARGRGLLVKASMNAPLLRGTLHTHLNREESLGVIDALDGRPSFLELRAKIEFRAAAPGSLVGMTLSSAELWDMLKAVSTAGMLSEDAIQTVFDRLVETSELRIPPGADAAHVFHVFRQMCSLFLRLEANGCLLGKRPGIGSVAFQERWNREVMRQVDLCCSLEQVLGSTLDSADREACMRVVGPSGDLSGGSLLSVIQRMRPKSFRDKLSARAIVSGNKIQTVAAALQPGLHTYPTADVLSTEAIRLSPTTTGTAIVHYTTPQTVFLGSTILGHVIQSLPVVSDVTAPLFTDRTNPSIRWYLPSVQLLSPIPTEATNTSPFLFELEKIGATASGQPAIRARIRFTLELGIPSAVSAALKGLSGVKAQRINILQPSVVLTVPYVDDDDGTLKRASYRGAITVKPNRIEVIVELLNDAARITYGSLSSEGFQSEPTHINFSYQFSCYAPVFERFTLVSGGKTSFGQILTRTREDDDAISVMVGGRELLFRPEKSGLSSASALLGSSAFTPGKFDLSLAALALSKRIEYTQKMIIRQQSFDAFFNCERLGSFYCEKQSTGTIAIGCTEAYRLGQASSRTYQEIPNLASASYRVFRNLQQPGRFLLVPLKYQITRYSPEVTDHAYHPIILIYSVLDPERPENTRIRFDATLAPDISPVEYRNLLRQLASEAQNPILDLPNILASDAECRWNLSSTPPVEITTDRTPEGFNVGLSTDLASSLLLKSMIEHTGVSGEVRFIFQDGTILTSTLSLNLGRITGPWPAGPIELQRNGGMIKLKNCAEGTLAVRDLVLFATGRTPSRIAVEKQLNPGASLDVSSAGVFDVALADFTAVGGAIVTLEEIRSVIEDIQSNVVFLDLVQYENYGLERLEVEARLKDVPGTLSVRMENRRGTVDFLLPLTTYLRVRIVEYRVNKVFRSKPSEITTWLQWDMENNSNIVSITWDAIR